ncbi:MAG: helix-turn-helix domain-containing protein [Candidatus Micrarchaeaceae archaeon]
MQKHELSRAAARNLESIGFATAVAKGLRSFVDIIAQHKGTRLAIKVSKNIDAVRVSEAKMLSDAASFIGADPVILGIRSRNGVLKSGVSYLRFSIRCINYSEISLFADSEPKYFASKSVGVKVMLDSKRLRRLRSLKRLTLRQLADEACVSKSTLYKHEHSYAYASLEVARKLERALGESIRIGSGPIPESHASVPTGRESLGSSDMRVLYLDNAPFGMLAKKRNYYAISYESDARTMRKKAAFFKELKSAINDMFPLFVSDSVEEINGIRAIPREKLNSIRTEEELVDYVY